MGQLHGEIRHLLPGFSFSDHPVHFLVHFHLYFRIQYHVHHCEQRNICHVYWTWNKMKPMKKDLIGHQSLKETNFQHAMCLPATKNVISIHDIHLSAQNLSVNLGSDLGIKKNKNNAAQKCAFLRMSFYFSTDDLRQKKNNNKQTNKK